MSQNTNFVLKKERIQYIDALRGFAMLLVVFVHVEIFSIFGFGNTPILANIISAFHMPLFFFISGFCVYKPEKRYGLTKVKDDFIRLIVPTCILGLLYTYFKINQDIQYFFYNPMKAGYWFTITMFEVLLIYYTINNTTRKNKKSFLFFLWIVAIGMYLLKLPLKLFPVAEVVGNYLCFHQTCNFFIFFAFGITVSMYIDKFNAFIANDLVPTIVLLVFIASSYMQFNIFNKYVDISIVWKVVETLGETLIGISGILLLYIIFYKNKDYFINSHIISRWLIIIGRNTLPIYLLHYFFLAEIPWIGGVLTRYPNVVVESLIALFLSLIVICVAIAIKNVFSISPQLAKLLLGSSSR